jgi:superfamily I DNA/RNA helicase
MDAIAEIIDNNDYEDVGILFPSNDMVRAAANYFKEIGKDVEMKTDDKIDLNWASTNPKIMTYWSAKGLQFEAVFIPNCNQIREETKKPLYVAMTRTYQSLYMTYSGGFPMLLSAVPEDLYETSLSSEETEEWL